MKKELVYDSRKGIIWVREGDTVTRLGRGYSGQPPYVNAPEAEGFKARGPIPRGRYRVGRPMDSVRLGALAMFLDPVDPGTMQGRSGFFIHGDNSLRNQSASHGCIILDRKVREAISKLVPIELEVVGE